MLSRIKLKRLFKPTLTKKLVATMLVLNILLIAILIGLYYQYESTLYNEFERQTSSLLKAVQLGLDEAARQGVAGDKSLHEYLKRLNLKGVSEISIVSNSDRIISSTNPRDVGKWVTRNKRELIFKAAIGEPVTGQEGQGYYVLIPVKSGDEQMGYIHLRVDTEDFSTFLRASAIRRVVAASLLFLMGMVLAVFLALRYTRPITDVVDAAERIAAGDLETNLPENRSDEIGDLARSFNYMAGKLREDKLLSERLRKAEHLAGVGELSQSVAHEIKNPLNYISLSVDHLRDAYRPMDAESAAKFDSLCANMKNEVQRVSRFVQNFLELGRPLELSRRPTDICALVDDAFELVLARARKEGIELVREFACRPTVHADPELIKTCLYNIITNALQSMPAGGAFTVRTSCEGPVLTMTFEDTGQGLSEDKASRVFDPYFTTKADGLGLGLALTRRIIIEHGGRIAFSSAPGKGSTVTVTLRTEGE